MYNGVHQESEKLTKTNYSSTKNISVSFFKLQYQFLFKVDYVFLIFAVLGSLFTGVSLPLFALFFGETVSNLQYITSLTQFVDYFRSMCLKFVYVGIGTLISGILMITFWSYNGRIISQRIKKSYFKLLMQQEQLFFDQSNTDELLFKVEHQMLEVESGLGAKVGNSIFGVSMFISSFVVSYYTSWKLSLVLSSIIPLFFLLGLGVKRVLEKSTKQKESDLETAGGIAEEVIQNIKTVASYTNYNFEERIYELNVNSCYSSSLNHGRISSILIGVFLFLMLNTFSLAIWYGSLLISLKERNTHGGHEMFVGDILVVIFTIVFGSLALGQTAPNLKSISSALIASSDYFNLLENHCQTEPPSRQNFKIFDGVIKFIDVSFYYPNKEKAAIKNMNLLFPKNKKIAIIGASGSGKSTIINLLLKLYDPLSGQITIDETDYKNISKEDLRNLIGYVPQEPILFNTSIKENIIFGRSNVSAEDLHEAIRLSFAKDFVEEKGLDYAVGVKGNRLSSGQRQRISLARAILTKPKFLVLDEATSFLDYKSEEFIEESLSLLSKQMTILIIANRIGTVRHVDYIYALKEGEIAEEGVHEELIKLDGLYSALLKNPNETGEVGMKIKTLPVQEVRESKIEKNTETIELNQQNKEVKDINTNFKIEIKQILLKHRLVIVLVVISLACMGSIWPVYGIMLATVFNALSQPELSLIRYNGEIMALYFLLMAGVTAIIYTLESFLLIYIGENLAKDFRIRIFKKYLTLALEFFERNKNSPSNLVSRLNNDTFEITGIALSMIGLCLQMLFALIVGIIISAYYDWRLCLISISIIPLTIICTVVTWRSEKKVKKAKELYEAEGNNLLTDSIINTRLVFAYNFQKKLTSMYEVILSGLDILIMRQSIINGISFGVVLLIMFVSFGIMFYAGATFLNDTSILLDNFLKSTFSILFSLFGITMGQQYIKDISKFKVSMENILDIFKEKSEFNLSLSESNLKEKSVLGKIEFKNICFSYPSGNEVLKNINFVINPGAKVAFVGFSGSGKSTILQLIEGFYKPSSGKIFIDDVEIEKYNPVELRKSIGYVNDESAYFKKDIFENIRYGRLSASDQNVSEAANKANISHYLVPQNKNQTIKLSGGEKQRVSLARLFLKNATINLLDEVTSALDKNNETQIKESINQNLKNKTMVLVTHKYIMLN